MPETSHMAPQHWLFSYGTLAQPDVQQALFGRQLESVEDSLPGFRIDQLAITDTAVIALSGSDSHPVLRRGRPEEAVPGVALAVTDEDLSRADSYEVSDYVRIEVRLASGRRSFVYVHRDAHGAGLESPPISGTLY